MSILNRVDLQIEIDGVYKSLDLDQSTSIAINYDASDLTNPTVTTVPYSSQISIPKTNNNDQIFQHISIRSRVSAVNSLSKIPFRLYVAGNLFQEGYIKIENVDVEIYGVYKIRLFGLLGNFFSELDNIRLDSLNIAGVTHSINASEVKKTFDSNNGVYGYALTYQGEYPEFDKNQTDNSTSDESKIDEATWNNTYTTSELDEHKRTEQGYKGEYRSYYQKPTLNFKTIWNGIKTAINSKGFNVVEDDKFFNDDNPYFSKLWLLNNQYDIAEAGNSYGFTSEFGDTYRDAAGSDVYISNNGAKRLEGNSSTGFTLRDVPTSEFISTNRASKELKFIISDAIHVSEGGSVDVNFDVKIYAISHFNDNLSGYMAKRDSRLGNGPINCTLRFIDSKTNDYIGSISGGINQVSPAVVAVQSRSFYASEDGGNVGRKRPSNRGNDSFGRGKSWAYDFDTSKKGDNYENEQDAGTTWSFKGSSGIIEEGVETIYVQLELQGSYQWTSNTSPSDSRTTGIAFKTQKSSSITVNPGINTSDTDEGTGGKRTNSEVTYKDIMNNDYSCFDLLTSYCKLFGLIMTVQPTGDIWVGLRENYYATDGQYQMLDWTHKIDRNKQFDIQPLSYNFRRGVFTYNSLGTKYEELYSSKNSTRLAKEYGSRVADNGYELEDSEFNYLEGTIFDNCIIATDSSLYYAGRGNGYKDNKQLPYLSDGSGGNTDINGFIPLFREDNPMELNSDILITDETTEMTERGIVCWNNSNVSGTNTQQSTNKIASYLRTAYFDGELYSLNFGVPNTYYSESERELRNNNRAGIYDRFWGAYLSDRLDVNSKLLTCYVLIEPRDIEGNILSKFIFIDGAIWVINKIYNYNPLSREATKVDLIKVQDIRNYLDRNTVTDQFIIMNNSNTVFNNVTGQQNLTVYINDTQTSITFDITSTGAWNASQGTPNSGTGNGINVITIPVSQSSTSVTYTYSSGSQVTVEIIRQSVVTVTATATNGGTALINGQSSPQQIAVGSSVTFSTTGTNQFLYWTINGERFEGQTVRYTITGTTTAVATYLAAGQVILYCDDPYTTITGQTKIDNYWILTSGTSYTFNNTQDGFSGFLFNSEQTFRGTGAKTINANDTLLTVFYNSVLLNLTVINQSTLNVFDGSYITLGDYTFNFSVEPGVTETSAISADTGTITFTRMPFHYPTFSQNTFNNVGIYNLTITGNRVGWDTTDGDQELDLDAGYQQFNRIVRGPIAYTIVSQLAVTPTSGNGQQSISITATGQGGEVVQRIGGFEYTLKINQPAGQTNIGWTSAYLPTLQVSVPYTQTTYATTFYYSGFPYTLGSGLTQSGANGTSTNITATFGENPSRADRNLTFIITCNGQSYNLLITQEGNPNAASGTYWGQVPDVNNIVEGSLTNADGLLPSLDGQFNLGSNVLRYNQAFVSTIYSGVQGYPLMPTYSGTTINGSTNGIFADGNPNATDYRRGFYLLSTNNSQNAEQAQIAHIYNGLWYQSSKLFIGEALFSNTELTNRATFVYNNNLGLYNYHIGVSSTEGISFFQDITPSTSASSKIYEESAGIVRLEGDLVVTGTVTEGSDDNIKQIIDKIDTVDLSKINTYEYVFTDEHDKVKDIKDVHFGVLAQEVESVYPQLVRDGDIKSVNYAGLTALLIAKVNELEKRITELEN